MAHDNILKCVSNDFKGRVASANRQTISSLHIPRISDSFIKAGSTSSRKKPTVQASLLNLANDWELLIDIDKSLAFPACTGVSTDLRPDVVIFSRSQQVLIWGELTSPAERRIAESANKKMKR